MSSRVLIFAGNSEADELILWLAETGADCTVCVASDAGEEALEMKLRRRKDWKIIPGIRKGRMDESEIRAFIIENKFSIVVDATHPYALEVSKNITSALEGLDVELMRLKRESEIDGIHSGDVRYFSSFTECSKFLLNTEGNIFISTGAKELDIFTSLIEKDRIYLRMLPRTESIEKAKACGLENSHLIAMQGVFSKELNKSLFREFDIKILVTKDSGINGGYGEKLEAAGECGILACVVKRPEESGLMSKIDIYEHILDAFNINREKDLFSKETGNYDILLAGAGIGDRESVTLEVYEFYRTADLVIASSKRLLQWEDEKRSGPKKIYVEYDPSKIADMIENELEINKGKRSIKIAVLFSGDSGFYSGAYKAGEELKRRNISFRTAAGISSLSALSAKSGIEWQDACILSIHGRKADIVAAVREHEKVFLLMNDAAELRRLSAGFLEAGLIFVKITAGIKMGSAEEKIITFDVSEGEGMSEEGICCCFIENKMAKGRRITPGLRDDAFVRGNVPMTKEEIRALSVCKMKIRENSVVWDIGAGTGSVTVECARLSSSVKVYSIEKSEEAIELISENIRKSASDNVRIIKGEAPFCLDGIEEPDAVFIGGSSGHMKEILEYIMHLEKHIQIVVNCVTIETVSELITTLKKIPHEDEEIVQVQVARTMKAGDYHIFKSLNPVFVISFRV